MNTQARLSEAYLLQAGLDFYRSLLQVQNSQIQSEVEQLESHLAQQEAQAVRLQCQQALSHQEY